MVFLQMRMGLCSSSARTFPAALLGSVWKLWQIRERSLYETNAIEIFFHGVCSISNSLQLVQLRQIGCVIVSCLWVSVLCFVVSSPCEPSASTRNHFHAYEDEKQFGVEFKMNLCKLPLFRPLGLTHSSCRNPKSELLHSNKQPFHVWFSVVLTIGMEFSNGIIVSTEP